MIAGDIVVASLHGGVDRPQQVLKTAGHGCRKCSLEIAAKHGRARLGRTARHLDALFLSHDRSISFGKQLEPTT